ncbi:uncharacterized protein [Epargyreus clarus]|uniref:uncharacterized protein n=1 Tax=Epargyreus clarus TaxID=520877 RepID=UPI003C2C3F0A
MSFNGNAFPEYLQSLIKLNELQKMTDDLDEELADSQQIMRDIKNIFDTIPSTHSGEVPVNSVRHEDLSRFLVASPPQLLMEDMTANTADVDLDVIIAKMKVYAEELRRNFISSQPQQVAPREVEELDLGGYATSLDQLVKRLANVTLNKHVETNNRNTELEAKLEELCKDVNMFTQMVEAKKTLSETNKNWTPMQGDTDALYYDNIINKLLAGINEVTYLLKNKN